MINFRRLTIATGILVLILGAFSCSSEDETPVVSFDETEEATQETDLTTTLEDVDEVILLGFQKNGFSDRTTISLEEDLCGEVNINWIPSEKKMIIDFGEGCTSPRGISRKGKITVTYTGRYWAKGTVITTTFDDYFVNERQIEGIRTLTNEGYDQDGLFFNFITSTDEGKITWPDGTFRAFEGSHTKRIFLPNNDRGLIYAVAGGTRGVNRKGNSYAASIDQPLIYSQRCLSSGIGIPSAGILSIGIETKGRIEVNFGTEGCDREVTITRGDQERTVTFPRS